MAEDNGLEPRDAIYAAFIPPEWVGHYIRAMDTPSQWLAQEAQKAEESQPLKDTPGTELPCSWTFPLSPAEQKELDDFLWENLANGRIHPSKSPMGAPVFFIKKKDGSLCLIQDYQKFTEITVKNSYPLPLVSDVLTCLCDAEFFTILNL